MCVGEGVGWKGWGWVLVDGGGGCWCTAWRYGGVTVSWGWVEFT